MCPPPESCVPPRASALPTVNSIDPPTPRPTPVASPPAVASPHPGTAHATSPREPRISKETRKENKMCEACGVSPALSGVCRSRWSRPKRTRIDPTPHTRPSDLLRSAEPTQTTKNLVMVPSSTPTWPHAIAHAPAACVVRSAIVRRRPLMSQDSRPPLLAPRRAACRLSRP